MKRFVMFAVWLLAAVGAATVVFFWRKNHRSSWDSTWSAAKDTTSSWGKTAADKAEEAGHRFSATTADAAQTASDVADEMKNTLSS